MSYETAAEQKQEKRTVIAALAMLVFLGRGIPVESAVSQAVVATNKLLAGLDAK